MDEILRVIEPVEDGRTYEELLAEVEREPGKDWLERNGHKIGFVTGTILAGLGATGGSGLTLFTGLIIVLVCLFIGGGSGREYNPGRDFADLLDGD